MTRLAVTPACGLLLLVMAARGAAMPIVQEQEPAQARPNATARQRQPDKPAEPERNIEMLSVRVIDIQARAVADVEIKVVEFDAEPARDGPGYRTDAYRTAADGRASVAVDRRFRRLTFEARPDDRTIGWTSLTAGRLSPKATIDDPVTLTLLPRNHHIEGTIVDRRGKPVNGVQVRAFQFNHETNGFATDHPDGDQKPSLAWTVTDERGRYRLPSLPKDATVTFAAYHPRFVGPTFGCKPDDQTIAPVTLADAGGIAGTVVDSNTGQPVANARIGAQRIEHTDRILGGGGGHAISNAQGQFAVGGLAPGVYNLLFQSSPKGRKFTARAVEGVRVKAGDDARAELKMIAGRRVHGRAVEFDTGKPLAGKPIFCYSESHPRSGAACQGTYTDDDGRFEHFVPPGLAFIYIAEPGQVGLESRKVLEVPADRDLDPIVLREGNDPNAKRIPRTRSVVECEVRVRVNTDAGDQPVRNQERSLTGRVFDASGRPLAAVQIHYNSNRTFIEAASDRLGIFRLRGLPAGPFRLGLRRNADHSGWAQIPAEAEEVDLIFPQ